MKLGVLLPTSKIYPALPVDFMSGIRLAFNEQNLTNDIEIVYQGIENGSNKELVINELNKMVLQNQVDVNVVFTNPRLAEEICTVTTALERPVIITNIGGNIPNVKLNSPYVLTNSLNLWESAYSASDFGIEKFGKKIIHGSYFYEAGYQLYQSFMCGVEKNNGEIVFNLISEFNPNPNDFSILMDKVKNENPNFLYLIYSERDAVSFLNKLTDSNKNGSYPIITSGVMLNDEIIKNTKGIPKNIFNICSWDKSLKNQINEQFCNEIKKVSGKEANYFSLLGYECGLAIANGFKSETWSTNGIDQYEAIKNTLIEGPRGKIDFCSGLGMTQYDNAVFSLDEKGAVFQYASLGKVGDRNQLIIKSQNEQNFTGWFQPYLCQ